MRIIFSSSAWENYIYWQKNDPKLVKQINQLIKEITRNPETGPGKPELLKYDLAGLWSRRINREHRLVYKVFDDELVIFSCRFHYDK
jgi:toxin YoeB